MEDGKHLDSHISLAMDIGMQMLLSGAQISRVEDSIGRICKALGAVETHVFSVTSGIIVTAFDAKGNSATQLRRIHAGSLNMNRLEKLNQLSRDICANRITDAEIPARLQKIQTESGLPLWMHTAPTAVARDLDGPVLAMELQEKYFALPDPFV